MRSSLALPPFIFLADECQLHSLSVPLTCSQKPMTKHLWGNFQRLCGTIEGASLRIMESGDLPPQSPYLCDLEQVTEPFWETVVIIREVERHFRPPKEGQGRATDDGTPSSLDSRWGAGYATGHTEGQYLSGGSAETNSNYSLCSEPPGPLCR